MNRNTILGFAGGLVFAVSLLIGLIVADNATDQGGGEPRLPGALGEPIEIISGTPISDPEAPVGFPIEPTQAAYVPIDTGGGSGGGSSGDAGGGGAPAGGGGSPSDGDTGTRDTGDDATELTVAPLAPEDAAIDADFRFDDFIGDDLYFEFLDYPLFRFLDLCADDGALPGCPFGVGGTVLAPFHDGGLHLLGDFRLGTAMRPAFGLGLICGTPEENEHLFYVWANHPATFDITYYPPSRPSDPTTVTVSNTDPDNSEFARFERDAVEGRLATSPWPRACFTLTDLGEPYQHYIVEVTATNYFGGPTASETYNVDITEGSRPAVQLRPFRDRHEISIRALIPVKRFIEGAMISFIDRSDATTCADAEADDRFGEIIPALEGGYIFSGPTDPRHESSPWSGYDPAYNGTILIDITGLQQGTTYLVCIWWFDREYPERSFDPAGIVDREMRWVTTPNRPSAVIWTHTVENTSDHIIAGGSYIVGFSCGRGLPSVTIPSFDMDAGTELSTDGSALCDYEGRPIQYPTVGFFITPSGSRHEFAIALDPSSPRSLQRFLVDLSTDASGPILTLHAQAIEGSDLGGDRWRTGVGETFEPPPEVPEELPADIQIDIFASGVEPAGRNGIRVHAEFDRPVRLRAVLLGELDAGAPSLSFPCLTGPEPSFDSNVSSPGMFEQAHSFSLDGLCFRTRYSVLLQVEDETGNRAMFHDVAFPPWFRGGRYFRGIGWTDGYHVEYTVRSLEGRGGFIHVSRFDVTIDGLNIDLRNPEKCLGRAEASTSSGTMVVGNEIIVTMNTVISSQYASDGPCGSSRRGRDFPYRASVIARIPIEDFEAGERLFPFELAHPFNESESPYYGTGFGINLRIVG